MPDELTRDGERQPATLIPEQLVYMGPGSQWTNAGMYFFCLVLAGVGLALRVFGVAWLVTAVFVAVAALIALALWLRVRFTIYRVTSYRIELERGWLAKRISNLDLFRIRDVSLQIGIVDRLLGIGDVTVHSTDADTPVQVLRGLRRPRPVYEHLKQAAITTSRRAGVVRLES